MPEALPLTEIQRRFLALALRRPGARRHELAERLGISPQTAMRAVEPLIKAGILAEQDESTGARGKPPKQVHFVQGALLTLAMVVARERITVSLSDLQGRPLAQETEQRDFANCADQIATLERLTAGLLAQIPAAAKLVFCGLTVSGFFVERGRRIVSVIDPEGWAQLDLQGWAEALTGVPVIVENDGRVLARSLLQEAPHRDFICVLLDAGIGGALVCDGRLLSGHHGNAGEIGRFFPPDQPRPTERSLRRALGRGDWTGWPGIAALGPAERAPLEAWLKMAACALGKALTQVLELLDFEAVFLCARLPDDIMAALCARIRIEPLGTSLGAGSAGAGFVLSPPAILSRPIGDLTGMTHSMATGGFLEPDPALLSPARRAPPPPDPETHQWAQSS